MRDSLVQKIRSFQKRVGEGVCLLTFVMVLVTFAIVVLRYVFQLGWVWLQESVTYMHAIVFLTISGLALQQREHVRVDVLSQKFSPRTQIWMELFGIWFFLVPVLGLIFYESFPYVLDAWKVQEGSQDSGGLPLVFLLKTFIWVFCFFLFLEALARTFEIFSLLKKGHLSKERELFLDEHGI